MIKRKSLFTAVTLSLCLFSSQLFSQQNKIAGAPENVKNLINQNQFTGNTQSRFISPTIQATDSFETTVFTYADIVIFSYFDDTEIKIYDNAYSLIENFTMSADTIHRYTGYANVYHVVGSKSFTVLIGDPITNYVNGYFAVDQAGRGVSTKLNTWMMNPYDYSSDFIIFGYEDNTGFTVRNLETGDLIAAGTLNEGEHYSFSEHQSIPANTPLQVTGTKPVSALSYSDQDYYIPSSNGYFTGNLFYGYSGIAGSWTNSITLTSYSDDNNLLVTNSVTGDTLLVDTLMMGQVATIPVNDKLFWKVETSGITSVANIPFGAWNGGYAYMARSIDEAGTGAGKLFFIPTIQSELHIFSFEPSNHVVVTKLGLYSEYPYPNATVIYDDTLDIGGFTSITSDYGSYVYKVESTGNVSVVQSNYGFGADFMPLSFALQLPDLTSSTSDVEFSIPDSVYVAGDTMTVRVTVHNVGSVDATNVNIICYDGDPDLGGVAPPIAQGNIPFIGAGKFESFKFSYVVPNNPEYRSIVVKIDPFNSIVESNKSNNKAQRFLRPNKDLLPPLSISVTAPSNLFIDTTNHEISPNPFTVRYDIFNTGNITATDVQITLELFNGLTLPNNTPTIDIGSLSASGSAFVEYSVMANPDSSGFNLYKATITASNAETKVVYRAVNVPDAIPPAIPQNFVCTRNDTNGVDISWTDNTEPDIAGYYLYYSSDSLNWNGTGADQGDSPIIIYGRNSYVLTGLPLLNNENTKFWFMLKAFDTSLNFSEGSAVSAVIVTDIEDEQPLPSNYVLSQNYPNPFNPSTVIRYSIPMSKRQEAENVKLTIYDILGNEIVTLVNQKQLAGNYEVKFDAGSIGRQLSSGIYLYKIQTNSFVQTKKMLLMK